MPKKRIQIIWIDFNNDLRLKSVGMKLREKAVEIPAKLGGCISLEAEEAVQLYTIIKKLLGQFEQ